MNAGTSEQIAAGAAGDGAAGAPDRIGQLETDRFCDGCGYNLHGQFVTRDERLGIPVCRCPECGRYHAASGGTTALHLWLKRVGTLVLVVWVATVCVVMLAGTALFGVLSFSPLRDGTVWEDAWVDQLPPRYPPGRYAGPFKPNDAPARGRFRVHRRVVPIPFGPGLDDDQYGYRYGRGYSYTWSARWSRHIGLAPVEMTVNASAVAGLGWGAYFAVALWHFRRRRCLLGLLAPVLGGVFALGLWWLNGENYMVRGWAVPWVAGYTLVQVVFFALGIWVGRSIARTVVRVVLPPKPRQALAFLWLADGRTPPGAG